MSRRARIAKICDEFAEAYAKSDDNQYRQLLIKGIMLIPPENMWQPIALAVQLSRALPLVLALDFIERLNYLAEFNKENLQ